MQRTKGIYFAQKKRAAKDGASLDYDLQQLRDEAAAETGNDCTYCSEPLTIESISFDHRQPISRAGRHCAANLMACCKKCNDAKRALTEGEYRQLLALLATLPADAANNVLARLKAAGNIYRR